MTNIKLELSLKSAPSALNKLFLSKWISLIAIATLLSVNVNAFAQSDAPVLADAYPERYTVVDGDTLWAIAGRFLRDPWRWPEVWKGNPQVENPDLIYPGDVLVMTLVDGRPILRSLRSGTVRKTVKLSPEPRKTRYDAIPMVDPAAIAAYINAPLVTDKNEMKKAAYVVDGFDSRLLMGKYDQFYARGVAEEAAAADAYRVFRPGRHFEDPVSGESLGWEAVHLGDANMLKAGDPARLAITRAYEEITIRDRLRAVSAETALPFFFPKVPENVDIRGLILETPNSEAEVGAMSVVAVNLGEREGLQVGDVLRIRSQSQAKKDPVTGDKYEIPEENVGVAMVFRTFEKVSYILITDTERQVRPGDVVVSPDAE